MYPYIILAFNIAPNTLIAKLLVNESVEDMIKKFNKAIEDRKNKDNDDEEVEVEEDDEEAIEIEDQGKEFIDNYLTGNIANTGKRWFNLPSIEEICNEIESHYGVMKG